MWYAIPGVFYAVWLFTLESDRRATVVRQLMANLTWLVVALALSFAIAALLRWAVQGWRVLTLSFAATVIGAGFATIAHSLVT